MEPPIPLPPPLRHPATAPRRDTAGWRNKGDLHRADEASAGLRRSKRRELAR